MALIDKASLLMVPSVYEDGTLYNVLPSGNKAPDETGNHNGYDQTRADFTFSRGFNLTATRVNADGLIEKGRENLFKYSNQFNNAVWAGSATWTSGQADKDGGTDAWLFAKSSATSSDNYSESITGLQTFSIYVKKEANKGIAIYNFYASTNARVIYNVETGALLEQNANVIDSNLVAYNEEWWRLDMTANITSTGYWYIYATDGTSTLTTDTLVLQNAQAELGLVATDYIETGATTATAGVLENTPRIDYSSGAGALLLEPQRTNLLPQSEYFGASGWGLDGGTQSITTNYGISPEGVKNAARLQLDKTGTTYSRLYYDAGSLGQATISVYMKSNTSQTQNVGLRYDGTAVNCEVTTEWKRFDLSATSTAVSRFQILLFDSIAENDETADILIYGAQMESSASYPSSYVPTYGSAATRGAESGVSDVDSLLTSNATYTWFVEFIVPESGIGGGEITFKDAGGSSQLRIYCNQNNTIGLRVEDGGQTHFINVSVGDTAKCLFQCSNGLVKGFYNGSLVHTFTIDAGMDAQKIHLGPPISAPDVKEVLLFNEALSDAECVTLTTL